MTEPDTRKLVAILFSDMVGFSAQMGEDESKTMETLKAHNVVLDREIATHSGRVVKTIGDAYMVEFSSSVSAVACGLEVQRAFAKMNEAAAEEHDLFRVRIGIHIGDVVEHQRDLFGDAVNIAARLEPLAPVGGLCVSAAVYEQVRKKVHASGEDGGFQRLKNISDPVRVLYLHPSTEHLDYVLGDQSLVTAPAQASKKDVPLPWFAAVGILLLAIAITAALDHDPGISPTPTPLHNAGAEEPLPPPARAQGTTTSPTAGTDTEPVADLDEAALEPSGTNAEGEPESTDATTEEEESARAALRKARKSRRLENRMRLRSTLEQAESETPTDTPATQGILNVVGDAHTVRLKGSDGSLHPPGTMATGQYAVWAAWSEGDEIAPTGISVDLAGGDIKTLRCSSGLQICQAP